MSSRISDKELISDLQRVKFIIGRYPSYEDVRQYGWYSPTTIQRRFGSWENAKRQIGWKPRWETFSVREVDPVDGAWLAGFIDGEDCFRIQKPSPSMREQHITSFSPLFTMSLRDDDLPALKEVKRILGSKLGFHIDNRDALHKKGFVNANPAYKIFVRDLPTLAFVLVPILDKYPLRTKKKDDFILFKKAVDILSSKHIKGRKNLAYTDEERESLYSLHLALKDIKEYNSDFEDVLSKNNIHHLFASN